MAKRKRVPKKQAEGPTSSCLVICDDVLLSYGKQKHFLQGVIGGILVPSLPAVIGPYVAYIRMSNVYGGQEIELDITRAGDSAEVFQIKATSPPGSDPLQTHTMILQIPPFQIMEVGRYIFSGTHGGVAFAQSVINIQAVAKEQK